MANFNFNRVILGGRLTADPELRQTSQGTSVTSFSIAVNRRFSKANEGQQATDFFNCVAWRSNAENISRYFKKGSSICVVGTIQNRTWTDQQGQKRYATDIVVEEFNFVDSLKESGSYAAAAPIDTYTAPAYSSSEEEAPKFEELSNDDDLPF